MMVTREMNPWIPLWIYIDPSLWEKDYRYNPGSSNLRPLIKAIKPVSYYVIRLGEIFIP